MGLLSSIKSAIRQPITFLPGNTSIRGFGDAPAHFSNNMQWFTDNHHVYAVTDWIAQKATQARWEVVDENGDQVFDSPLQSFISRPNLLYSFKELVYILVVNDLIEGQYFLQGLAPIVGPNKGKIQEIIPIPFNYLDEIRDSLYRPSTYKLKIFSDPIYLNAEFSFHQKRYGFNGHALSPFQPLKEIIESSRNGARASNKMAYNMGVQGFLTAASDNMQLSPEQVAEMQTAYEKKYTRVDSQYRRLAMISHNMKWVQVGTSMADLQLIEQDYANLRKICAAVQVGSQIFNDPSAAKYDNMKQAVKFSFRDAVFPQLDGIEDMMNTLVAKNYNKFNNRKLYFRYTTEHIPELQEDLNELYSRLEKADDLTDNEKRVLRGFEPLPFPEMDIPRVSKDKIPITALSELVESMASKALGAREKVKVVEERLLYDLLNPKVEYLKNDIVYFGEAGLMGRVEQVYYSGTIEVPGYDVALVATDDDAVAVIRIIIDAHLSQHLVIQKFSKMSKVPPTDIPMFTDLAY